MANMMKVFFRELQPSLMEGIPEDVIVDMSDMDSSMFGRHLLALPTTTQTVLIFVFDILARVALEQEQNMMTFENLGKFRELKAECIYILVLNLSAHKALISQL